MGSTLRQRILRGLGASAYGQVVNVIIQLVGVPAYLAIWGVERYGDWLVLASWAAFLSMSDVGFASAAGNEMTMRVGRGDQDGALSVYHSMWTFLSLASLTVFGIVAAALWSTGAASAISLKTATPNDAAWILLVLAAHVLLSLQLGVLDAGFRCDGNFALGVSISSTMRLMEFAGQVATAYFTGSMLAVAIAGVAVRASAGLVSGTILRIKSPWLQVGWREASWQTLKPLVRPALSFLGMPLGAALSTQGMIQVASKLLGPGAVVALSAHRTLTYAATQLMNMVNHAVWPELSRAHGAGDVAQTRRLHQQACATSIWAALACATGVMATGWWVLPTWTHGKVHQEPWLMAGFLTAVVLRSLWYTSSVVPMATNRHWGMAVLYSAGGAGSLVLAWLLIPRFGIAAAAFAVAASDLVMGLYVLRLALEMTADTLGDFVRAMFQPPFARLLRARWAAMR